MNFIILISKIFFIINEKFSTQNFLKFFENMPTTLGYYFKNVLWEFWKFFGKISKDINII